MTDLPSITRRSLITAAGAAGAATLLTGAGAIPAQAATRLTNLAHLDALTTTVRLPVTAAHTTYRLRREPNVGMLWVYADVQPDGSYRPVGGGSHDVASDTWGQGAYDADDVARAAVVYLREWKATGSAHARRQAYQQLRGLAYFQTLTGEHAGEFPPVDAARRHPEPHPGTSGQPEPGGRGRILLDGSGAVGLRGGLRGLPQARPRPSPPSWPVGWTWQSRRSNATR